MPRKLTPALRAEIRRRKHAGDTLREIGRALELSPTTVSKGLVDELVDIPVPYDPAERREWALAELGEDPRFEDELELEAGSVFTALANLGRIDAAWFFDAAELAALVVDACECPGGLDDAPASEAGGKAELARSVKLLEDALAIVRKRGIAPRWRKSTRKARA